MRSYVLISLAVFALLGVNGCVSKGQHTAAMDEAGVARADLERVQAQKEAVEQQVKTLKELNAKLSQEAQLAKDELQRIEHGRDTERGSLSERNKELKKQIRTLAAQHRVVRRQYQQLRARNKALQSTVARYQKELKELRRGGSPVAAPRPPKPPAMTPKSAAMPKPTPAPSAASRLPATTGGKPTAVNLNTASVNDMVLKLGLSKEDAGRVVSNRPYRIRGEIVAKNVLPKTTFDKIYDRITVRQ